MSHTLADRFSQLKLRGCARAYLEQLDNPSLHQLSFDDRLTLLLEREELERSNRILSLRISQARFKQPASFDTLTPNSARGLDQTLLKTLGTCDFVRKKRNILITGPSGCGKSYLATALSHQACLMGFSAKYYRAPQLLAELVTSQEEGQFSKIVRQINKHKVLIIDDFLLSALDEDEQKTLFELLEDRHEQASTLFTSQNPVTLWHQLMPNPAIADAILDRITSTAIRVELKGDSLRKKGIQDLD